VSGAGDGRWRRGGCSGQILQHAAWSAEGRFDVDHPIDLGGRLAPSLKGCRITERFQFAVKMQSAVSKRVA